MLDTTKFADVVLIVYHPLKHRATPSVNVVGNIGWQVLNFVHVVMFMFLCVCPRADINVSTCHLYDIIGPCIIGLRRCTSVRFFPTYIRRILKPKAYDTRSNNVVYDFVG